MRRPMCQQNVDSLRNPFPDPAQRLASIEVKRPVEEARLPRTAIDPESMDHTLLILQIRRVSKERSRLVILFKQKVVIARNDYFVAVSLRAEPIIEISHLRTATPTGKIAGTE